MPQTKSRHWYPALLPWKSCFNHLNLTPTDGRLYTHMGTYRGSERLEAFSEVTQLESDRV